MAFVSSAGMCPPRSLTYELPRQDYIHALHPRRASLLGWRTEEPMVIKFWDHLRPLSAVTATATSHRARRASRTLVDFALAGVTYHRDDAPRRKKASFRGEGRDIGVQKG